MSRLPNTKLRAARIDPSYVRRPDSLRMWLVIVGFAACLAALATWLVAEKRDRSMMYSPGAVATVHAIWGTNCASCHDANGRGGFSKSVSDGACLRCHDGPIHHPNQSTMVGADRVGHQFAASCASCHVEHRGHAALAASSDEHCLQCHADLSKHSLQTPPWVTVTAFDTSHHPSFGRSLTTAGQKVTRENWKDPTRLAFHHKTHINGGDDFDLRKIDSGANVQTASQKCVVCHRSQPPPSSQPAPSAAGSDGRYMQATSYAADCAACHPIRFESLSSDLKPALSPDVLPHADLSIVRQEIERRLIPSLHAATFTGPPARPANEAPKEVKPDLFHRNKPPAPPGDATVDIFHHHAAPPESPAIVDILRDEWIRRNDIFILGEIDKFHRSSFPRFEGAVPGADAISAAGDPPKLSDEQFVEIYLARVVLTQCNKCHYLGGQFPSLMSESPGQSLVVLPTGLNALPRKWFVNSRFDHRAHRNLSCLSCHSRAADTDDDQVLMLPDLADPQARDVSCTQCHHDPAQHAGAATSNCTTCHQFHDRSRERSQGHTIEVSQAEGAHVASR